MIQLYKMDDIITRLKKGREQCQECQYPCVSLQRMKKST